MDHRIIDGHELAESRSLEKKFEYLSYAKKNKLKGRESKKEKNCAGYKIIYSGKMSKKIT